MRTLDSDDPGALIIAGDEPVGVKPLLGVEPWHRPRVVTLDLYTLRRPQSGMTPAQFLERFVAPRPLLVVASSHVVRESAGADNHAEAEHGEVSVIRLATLHLGGKQQ